MWIILLDHSGSMGDSFSHSIDKVSRTAKETEHEIKLAAAKEVLIGELSELSANIEVVIFGFTSVSKLIFEGKAGQKSEIHNAIYNLEANNGTNIAAALDSALLYKKLHHSEGIPRIVLISDGKSDKTQAMLSARKCVEESLGVHFILIDPTEEGKSFYREVVGSIGGTFIEVLSKDQFKESARSAAIEYKDTQAKAEKYLGMSINEAAEIEKEIENTQNIEFTAGYPGHIKHNIKYQMFVYMHSALMREEVQRRLSQIKTILGETPRKSETGTNYRIPVGTVIEITPKISNVIVSPSHYSFSWLGEMEEAMPSLMLVIKKKKW